MNKGCIEYEDAGCRLFTAPSGRITCFFISDIFMSRGFLEDWRSILKEGFEINTGCRKVFLTNAQIHFFAVNGEISGRGNTDLYLPSRVLEDGKNNSVTYANTFIDLPSEYQHCP